jgi:hypothetical protein
MIIKRSANQSILIKLVDKLPTAYSFRSKAKMRKKFEQRAMAECDFKILATNIWRFELHITILNLMTSGLNSFLARQSNEMQILRVFCFRTLSYLRQGEYESKKIK